MRQAGRYLPEYRALRERAPDFLEFCYTPDLAVEATLQPLRRFDMDAAILFSDILVVPHALGQPVSFEEGIGPVLEAVRDLDDLRRLNSGRPEEVLGPVYETVATLKGTLPDKTALIGFAGAPWTLATYMVEGRGGTDHGHVKNWAYRDAEGFGELIGLLTASVTAHLSRQIESGADVVQLFDSWAGVLAETQFRRWVLEPTAEIVRHLKDKHPEARVIGFPRGAGALYGDYADATGVDVIAIDEAVPAVWAADTLQRGRAVQGNLSNLALVNGGQTLADETHRILGALGGGPFIFNLGHGVLPGTPPENVARLASLIRGWGP
jgi:uroporphyrinogen decarboxylase